MNTNIITIKMSDIKEPIIMYHDDNDHGIDQIAPEYLNPCVGYFIHKGTRYNIYAFQYQPDYEEHDPLYFRNQYLKRVYLEH